MTAIKATSLRHGIRMFCALLCIAFFTLATTSELQAQDIAPAPLTTPASPISFRGDNIVQAFTFENSIRLLFQNETPYVLEATKQDGLITLGFNNEINFDPSQILAVTRSWVASVNISNDRKKVFLGLTRNNVEVRQFLGERFIGVDLVATTEIIPPDQKEQPQIVYGDTIDNIDDVVETQEVQYEEVQVYDLIEGEMQALSAQEIADYEKQKAEEAEAATKTVESQLYESQPKGFSSYFIEENTQKDLLDASDNVFGYKEETPIYLPSGELPIGFVQRSQQLLLGFRWGLPVASAALFRGSNLWLVFNKAARLNFDAVKQNPYIKSIWQIDNAQNTILKIQLNDDYGFEGSKKIIRPRMQRSSGVWVLSLTPIDRETFDDNTTERVIVTAERGAQGAQLFLSTNQAAEGITIQDKTIGESYTIIPLYASSRGVVPVRRYVDVEILETVQGVAYRPLSDGINHRIQRNGISIFSDQYAMRISPERILAANLRNAANVETVLKLKEDFIPAHSILDFNLKGSEDPSFEDSLLADEQDAEEQKSYIEERRELYTKLIVTPREQRSPVRFEIAEFFFSKGLYVEALGVLRDIQTLDPLFEKIRLVEFMQAIAHYTMGHHEESNSILYELLKTSTSDAEKVELSYWVWANQSKLHQIRGQEEGRVIPADYVSAYDQFLNDYPNSIRYEFGLLAIQNKVELGDVASARTILEVISYDEIPNKFRNETDYYFGKIAALEGDYSQAISLWEPLTEIVEDRKSRAYSTFELTNMRLNNGNIDAKQAISILEKMLPTWRGDMLEIKLLQTIGELQLQEENYRGALKSWETIANSFPNSQEALVASANMKQTFIDIFDRKDMAGIDPFKALTIYFEFRELTPVGEQGDRIIQQLANRFIEMDLLDNAITILLHQLRFRSVGDKRNAIALQLAELQLKNQRPESIAEALSYMDYSSASPEEMKESKYLRATSYVLLNQHRKALELLINDFSTKAQDIRLKVFWLQQNWFGIINIIEPRLFKLRNLAPTNLTEEEAKQLIKLTIAYAAQHRNIELKQEKIDFLGRIEQPELRTIFDFLTTPNKKLEYTRLEQTTHLDHFTDFVNDYGFWPGKQWREVVINLEPKAMDILQNIPRSFSNDQKEIIFKYSIAAIEYLRNPTGIDTAAERDLRTRTRAEIKLLMNALKNILFIDSSAMEYFKVFDDRFENKYANGGIFEKRVAIDNLPTFIDNYKNAKSIEQLNSLY